MPQETIHLKGRIWGEHIFRLGENIFDKSRVDDPQRYFAVNAAECEVVNLMPERWDVGPFARDHLHGQHIVGVKFQMWRQFERKRSVSALVFTKANSVEPNRRSRHYTLKIDKDMPTTHSRGEFEVTAIARHKFIVLIVKAVPGQASVGVGNHHPFEFGIVEVFHAS